MRCGAINEKGVRAQRRGLNVIDAPGYRVNRKSFGLAARGKERKVLRDVERSWRGGDESSAGRGEGDGWRRNGPSGRKRRYLLGGLGLFSQQRLCTKPETAHSLSYHNINQYQPWGEQPPLSHIGRSEQVILSHLGNRWPRPTCPDLPDSGRSAYYFGHTIVRPAKAKRNKKKQALSDCVFFLNRPCVKKFFGGHGNGGYGPVNLISEECERDAHHCTFPSSSCAAPSSVEGVSCALRLLYRNTVFFAHENLIPVTTFARPKGAHDFIYLPLLRLSLVERRPRKHITSLNKERIIQGHLDTVTPNTT
jgi:hypothetical protein